MSEHFIQPHAAASVSWSRVILTDDHTRVETFRQLAAAFAEDPAAVLEHLGALVEVMDQGQAFSDAVIDLETDLQIGPAQVELRYADAVALGRELEESLQFVAATQPTRLRPSGIPHPLPEQQDRGAA